MGYHLILRNKDGSMRAVYADTLDELCVHSDIGPDAILYEADRQWTPVVIGEHERYKKLSSDWYRAGIKAQGLFRQQALAEGLIPEKISQDTESFEAYRAASPQRVKRGDYLLRRVNKEVEVKCLTLYGGEHFYLPYGDIKAHENMAGISSTPVWFALYRREGDEPVADSLCTVPVIRVMQENRKGGAVGYDEKTKCLKVPLGMLQPGFAGLMAS